MPIIKLFIMNNNVPLKIPRRKISVFSISLFLFIFLSSVSHAQQSMIKGNVLTENGNPLPGVTVRVEGTSRGTTTNAEGHFQINAHKGDELIFSFLGYLTRKIKVNNPSSPISVKLSEDIKQLNSVVVVGYGTQKKENLTGAISTLNMDEKKNQPITNISNALHGMPGLFVKLGNSMPGVDRAQIRIRGIGTLNNNDPLVLVDGVEYPMDELNPNDIASISVLKDASAAIYGSRAANGVILVTTKTGKGKSKVNYNYYFGLQSPTVMPDVIWDPIVYMKLMNQAALNEGKSSPYFSDAEVQEYQLGMKTDPFTYPAINWFDRILETGTIQKHDISVSGSTEKVHYRLSLGYLDRDGIIQGPVDGEKKYSVGLNTSFQVNPKLKVGLTLNGYYRQYSQPTYSNGSFWNYLMRALPVENDTLADGNYGYTWLRVPGRNNWEQPRMLSTEGYWKKYIQRFVSSLYADYQLPFDINYHIKFGVDKYDGFTKTFVPQMFKIQAKTGKRYNWNSPSTAPRSYNYDDNDMNIHFYNTVDWKRTFNKEHHLSVMLGASYDNYVNRGFMAEMTGYLDGTLDALDAGSIRQNISGNETRDVLESYFGRVNYNYKGKYLLEGIFRYDGSSRFAQGHRWGFFPGLSAGWRIDKENFFSSHFINLLKIRASYGQLGNQAVDLYSYENSITLGHDYSFGGPNGVLASGAAATAYSDPSISWETTTDYDLGVDVNFWGNRINLTADVYKKVTTGILRTVNLPSQVGNLSGPKKNVGSMQNVGYEINLRYRNNAGPFDYNIYGNVSYNKNKVLNLNGQILYNFGTNLPTITKEGYPVDAFYVLQAEGIFQSDEEVSKHAYQSEDTKAGYIKYKDVKKDGTINGDDRIIIPSSTKIPKYTYGFGFDVSYKGLSLSGFFQGIAGIKMYLHGNVAFPLNNGANATWEWVTDSWTKDRPNAKLPIITEANYGSKMNYQSSTFWMKNGAYLRLRNVQLAYALPEKWLSAVNIQQLNVFVNAQNPLLFSQYKDYDPETVSDYISLYHYPMLKTFSAGVNVTF